MTIEAKIIADSMSPAGVRLTTMQLRYPRFIHAEFMTHRVFSRNASSSRAIPVERMIEDLRRDPAMPVFWGSHKPGMQAGEELGHLDRQNCEVEWRQAMEICIAHAEEMVEYGLHKQIANRILEPWAHINVVVTATDWDNFFALRAHPDAQPEIHALALEMFNALAGSQPRHLRPGEWHLPYVNESGFAPAEVDSKWLETLRRVSVARCARVSYLTHDGKQTTVQEDLALYDRLLGSQPIHASPAEHQGTPDTWIDLNEVLFGEKTSAELQTGRNGDWANPEKHGNFTGWIQFRKLLEEKFSS